MLHMLAVGLVAFCVKRLRNMESLPRDGGEGDFPGTTVVSPSVEQTGETVSCTPNVSHLPTHSRVTIEKLLGVCPHAFTTAAVTAAMLLFVLSRGTSRTKNSIPQEF